MTESFYHNKRQLFEGIFSKMAKMNNTPKDRAFFFWRFLINTDVETVNISVGTNPTLLHIFIKFHNTSYNISLVIVITFSYLILTCIIL